MSVSEALGTRWETDAHFVPYAIPGLAKGDSQPRINDSARKGVLLPAGMDPLMNLAVIDVDAPKSTEDVRAWSLERINRVLESPLSSGCAWYVTRGGFRLAWGIMEMPIPVYLDLLSRVRGYLQTLDIQADRLVDWNRCYRLPFVVRDGIAQDHPADLDRLGPMPEVPVTESPFQGIDKARTRVALVVPSELHEGDDPGRKRTLFRLAAKLRDAGADEDELIAALTSLNVSRCKPPLSEDHIHKIARSALRYEPSPAKVEELDKTVVVVKPGILPELVSTCQDILADSAEEVFQRAGMLVCVDREPDPRKGTDSTPGTPSIRELKRHRLRILLASGAAWKRLKKSTDAEKGHKVAELTAKGVGLQEAEGQAEYKETPTDPPMDLVDALRDAGRWKGISPLIGVTETPTLRSDGTVLDVPGYDVFSGIYFSPPNGLVFPAQGEPELCEAEKSLRSLEEVLQDFPFGGDAHKSVAIAAMLTAVGRFGIEGPTPLFLFDAHTAGSGKGLLSNVVSILCTGRSAPVLSLRDDTETEKRITAHLCSGQRVILLDNVSGTMGGPALDAALTADIWSGRILGQSALVEVPNRATWIATGNNVAIRGDLSRRTLRCYLDVGMERPEERQGFSRPDLLGYVRKHRGRLVGDCLNILSAYIRAGRPELGLCPMGSFEEWSKIVRSALVWTGAEDPYLTRKELRETADRDVDAWTTVLEAWFALHGTRPLTVPDLVEDMDIGAFGGSNPETGDHRKALKEALVELAGGRTGELNPRRVGWVLAKHRARIVGGRRLVRSDRASSGRRWFVEDLQLGALEKTI
tara:strand:- start:342 stop:2771 length:2430 start_codon:yes stop_codon:yes gene_type:complete